MTQATTGSGIALTPAELREVTNRVRPSAQARALRALGIDHKVRPDGSLLVLRNSLQPDEANAKVGAFRIDWDGFES